MQDRMIKVLLVVVALLLFVLALRPQATTAQSPSGVQPVMAVDQGMIYVLHDDKLSIYYADAGLTAREAFALIDPQARLSYLKRTRIYRLASQDLSTAEMPKDLPAPAKPKGGGRTAP